jgi:hypothetical protein
MRTLTQRYHDYRISNIHKPDVRELLKEKIKELILDFGQKVETVAEQDALIYLVNRVNDLILQKYRYWTWGDIELAMDRGKVGQYSRGTVSSSKVTVQKIETWLFHFSEERSRQRQNEKKTAVPEPVDKSKQAPPEYGAALSWKMKHLKEYPQIWDSYDLNRIIEHIKAGTIKKLTQQVNIEKENYEPQQSCLTAKSKRKRTNRSVQALS